MIGSLWFNSFSAGGAPAGGDAYELISTTVLGSSAASVTFSGLGTSAAAYKHLQIRGAVRGDRAAGYVECFIRFNGDSGTNYAGHELDGSGVSVSSYNGVSQTSGGAGYAAASTNTASAYGAIVTDILDFASTSKNKTIRALTGVAGSSNLISLKSGLWMSTAAVTSLEFIPYSGNFITGSRFSLYGLK